MTEQILAVQRMQDYIDAHLTEDITLVQLAGCSLYSPWHAYRLFREHAGLSPAEYIRKLRLSRSAMRLKNGQVPIRQFQVRNHTPQNAPFGHIQQNIALPYIKYACGSVPCICSKWGYFSPLRSFTDSTFVLRRRCGVTAGRGRIAATEDVLSGPPQ